MSVSDLRELGPGESIEFDVRVSFVVGQIEGRYVIVLSDSGLTARLLPDTPYILRHYPRAVMKGVPGLVLENGRVVAVDEYFTSYKSYVPERSSVSIPFVTPSIETVSRVFAGDRKGSRN
ncbi:MAG: hypothetical protein U0996_24930 [Planctomycetaceae bacterium]